MGIEILVSVIIPAYNHAGFVQSCIESVAKQSYQNLELIIINDGSTDHTNKKIIELLPRYKDRFVDITYIDRENKGIGATLNELLSHAKGEYVFQIASDDMAKPEAIEKLLGFLEENQDYGLAVGDNEIIDADDKRVYWDVKKNNTKDLNKIKYTTFGDFLQKKRPDVDFNSGQFGELKSLLMGNYIPNGKMFRKSAIIEVGGYIDNVLEDYYINILIAKKYKLKYLNQVLFSYRWHEKNTIKNRKYIKTINRNMNKFIKTQRLEAKQKGIITNFFIIKILIIRMHNLPSRIAKLF